MRTRVRLAAAIILLTGGLAAIVQAAPASAATYGIIYNASNPLKCIDDPGDSLTPGTGLVLWDGCHSLSGENWTANPSSYNNYAGWYSIVLQNTSHGEYCIDDPGDGGDGTQLVIRGCNGSEEQAWYATCFPGIGPEMYNPAGWAIDLYGDKSTNGTPIVAWHYEATVPPALIFWGPPGLSAYGGCE